MQLITDFLLPGNVPKDNVIEFRQVNPEGSTMFKIIDVLSLWEIAHRWHDEDPNLTNPQSLPLAVQDSLRLLTKAAHLHQLHLSSQQGVVYWNANDIPAYKDFLCDSTDPDYECDEDEKYRRYTRYEDTHLKRHRVAVEGFEHCYLNRRYDKARLDNVFMTTETLAEYCFNNGIELPVFWYSEKNLAYFKELYGADSEIKKPTKLTTNQQDRELCRAIAQTLWSIYPEMTIVEITNHPAIQQYGNGRLYPGRDTLRNWVKDLNPKPVNQRRGRPKKRPESNS